MAVLDVEVRQRAMKAAHVLGQMTTVRAAYVFGSQVEGNSHCWSDIDVALFLEGLEDWDMRRRAQAMVKVQKEAGLDVEAHLFPASVLEHHENSSFAAYIIKNGILVLMDTSDKKAEDKS